VGEADGVTEAVADEVAEKLTDTVALAVAVAVALRVVVAVAVCVDVAEGEAVTVGVMDGLGLALATAYNLKSLHPKYSVPSGPNAADDAMYWPVV